MIAEYKKNVNLFIGCGLLLQFASYFIQDTWPSFTSILLFVGFILFIYGVYNYVKAKGYSGWFTILGFFSLLGLIILVLLPDHRKQG